ncbi:MAG TPA: molybdenum ABC transporter ATP-binding protein [Burkholderiaceae bacterium]|nr:molybdenum ABC transporter ATP-binding protein [Burkholderiaceae bacterium]
MIELHLVHQQDRFVLDAAFTAPSDGVTAIFGESGAGKTTLIHAVAGLITPRHGRIALNDTVLFDSARGVNLPSEQRGIGVVFQDARLFPHLSVQSNLRYGERRARGRPSIARFDDIVDLLGLRALLSRRPMGLSGGERQRVAIGRALLAQPRLLLLDEPLASLDAPRKAEVLPYLERLRDAFRVPMLYVTHAIDEVLRIADAAVVLHAGVPVAVGPVARVMSGLHRLPIGGARFEAGTVIEARVDAHDTRHALTMLDAEGLRLRVPRLDQPTGSRVRVRVRARDVAISLVEPTQLSFGNAWAATIQAIDTDDGPYADIRLMCASTEVHAAITRESVERLHLRPGARVWALVKTVTLDTMHARLTIPRQPSSNT